MNSVKPHLKYDLLQYNQENIVYDLEQIHLW